MPNSLESTWPKLAWLQGLPESERRWLLRFHRETVSSSDGDADRLALDEELGEIGRLELQAEVASGPAQQRAIEKILAANTALSELIYRSSAFSHYLNSYLYFKVRFAAGRSDNPCRPGGLCETGGQQLNLRPVGIPSPPVLPSGAELGAGGHAQSALLRVEGRAAAEAQTALVRFFGLTDSYETREALQFLDGFVKEREETRKFELWMRGLYPEPPQDGRFHRLAKGICEWAEKRYWFYLDLERAHHRADHVRNWLNQSRMEGSWHARNPLAARCGVTDLYWLAKVLRAEVSPRGIVTYVDRSWLYYLPQVPHLGVSKEQALRVEDVLRAVFDYACELIQNAVEMAEYCEMKCSQPDEYPDRPSGSDDWRAVQDGEIDEIGDQRQERLLKNPDREQTTRSHFRGTSGTYWSERIRTGDFEENLVGVALSGGGIRSATFALGVLQHLKELDLLRHVDYLSTVSGGGYTGAWLLGNVRRSRYFLSRMTDWEKSISHLRRYSKYLAPQSGFLSADTWVMWGTWSRNAILIQLTAIAWIWAAFTLTFLTKAVFDWTGAADVNRAAHISLGVGFVFLAVIIAFNLLQPLKASATQHRRVVLLAWLGSFLTAALLWSKTTGKQDYSVILATELSTWPWYIGPGLMLSMWALTWVSFWQERKYADGGERDTWTTTGRTGRLLGSIFVAALCAGLTYLGLCGVRYLFGVWTGWGRDEFGWYAYVLGPPLVLLAITLAVVVFIGLVGRTSADWRREWWTRYGSWLAMYGTGFLALALAAVFGHFWIQTLVAKGEAVKWTAVASWIASVTAGLLAGNSSKTKGNGEGSSQLLEWVARIGGVLFIAGAVLLLSTALQSLLTQVWLSDLPAGKWWQTLNALLSPKPWSIAAAPSSALLVSLAVLLWLGFLFSWRFNLNVFGLNQFYRNRLVRCYLGATRWKPGLRRPDGFTGFDEDDDLTLSQLQYWYDSPEYQERFRGPFPIINCALNLGGSSDLTVKTRQSTSFTLTPLNAGAARAVVGFVPMAVNHEGKRDRGFSGAVSLGQAISVSGAAASPNMGYNTSPLVSVLLTMFNVRLAWWFPNPGEGKWRNESSPVTILYLLWEFLGLADEKSDFVNVSDGGHFENLAIYELIRRRTKVIIASDAECDPDLSFGSLGNLIRICETDFGAKIDIDVASIRKQSNGKSRAHCAVGRITYSNGSLGYLIYLKSSITGDEDSDIEQYRAVHPDFPHQSTGDQFFTEDQFESYRRLGHHIAKLTFRDVEPPSNLAEVVDMASKLYDVWTPGGFSSDAFVKHAAMLDDIWERFRGSTELLPLLQELMADRSGPLREGGPSHEELAACLELVQLMENVFLDLRLDDFWGHPDNRGWAMLFTMWAKSPTFRAAWGHIRRTFGIRFEYFCHQHLGLDKDTPVVRVG